jgi:hypothetical protein
MVTLSKIGCLVVGTSIGCAIGYYYRSTTRKTSRRKKSKHNTAVTSESIRTTWINKYDGDSPTKQQTTARSLPIFQSITSEKHTITIEPGCCYKKQTNYIVAAAASCLCSGLLAKLRIFKILDIEIQTTAERTGDIFTALSFHLILTSPDANPKQVKAISIAHIDGCCSALLNLMDSCKIAITSEVQTDLAI